MKNYKKLLKNEKNILNFYSLKWDTMYAGLGFYKCTSVVRHCLGRMVPWRYKFLPCTHTQCFFLQLNLWLCLFKQCECQITEFFHLLLPFFSTTSAIISLTTCNWLRAKAIATVLLVILWNKHSFLKSFLTNFCLTVLKTVF